MLSDCLLAFFNKLPLHPNHKLQLKLKFHLLVSQQLLVIIEAIKAPNSMKSPPPLN